mmetsp:Transcript_80347/g.223683  ORF Transcript_80347/g.223683 Transcript_80347/m.223683 type:complete len:213 (-) Transcript_80347:45-683(-)
MPPWVLQVRLVRASAPTVRQEREPARVQKQRGNQLQNHTHSLLHRPQRRQHGFGPLALELRMTAEVAADDLRMVNLQFFEFVSLRLAFGVLPQLCGQALLAQQRRRLGPALLIVGLHAALEEPQQETNASREAPGAGDEAYGRAPVMLWRTGPAIQELASRHVSDLKQVHQRVHQIPTDEEQNPLVDRHRAGLKFLVENLERGANHAADFVP